jgi:hypothetical protein
MSLHIKFIIIHIIIIIISKLYFIAVTFLCVATVFGIADGYPMTKTQGLVKC